MQLARFGRITASLDGTRIAANASKHAALSHERAGQGIARLELEVQQLLAKAGRPARPLEIRAAVRPRGHLTTSTPLIPAW